MRESCAAGVLDFGVFLIHQIVETTRLSIGKSELRTWRDSEQDLIGADLAFWFWALGSGFRV